MSGEDFKFTIEGVEYHRLEDVPEAYRELARRQAEAAVAAADAAAATAAASSPGIKVSKHIKINFKVKRMEPGAGAPGSAVPITPGAPPFVRWLAFLAAAAALLAWILLRRH